MRHALLLALLPLFSLHFACDSSRAKPPVASAGSPGEAARPSVAAPHPELTENGSAVPPSSSPAASAAGPGERAWIRAFDDDGVNTAPAGFAFGRTGGGRAGRWVVRAEPGAPSGSNVLAQLDADDTDYRFPVAVLDQPSLVDVEVRVRCKLVSGKVDRACGLVARYRDADNYYLTRANGLEDNIRFYIVKNGHREQLASRSEKIESGVWHEYRLRVRGDRFEVSWDGRRVLEHVDSTFRGGGRVGLWTKADSVTYFDDLRVDPLASGTAP